MERRLALSLIVLASLAAAPALAAAAGGSDAAHRPWSVVPRGPYAILPATPENFTVSDGTHISYAVHRPAAPAGTRVPVIVSAGPYFALAEEPVHVPSSGRLTGFLIENFVPHGYAVVAASVRGTGWSGGCMELMSAREGRDIDELVSFLAAEPWSTGAVALTGKSYDGGVAWNVARFGNPALKTIVPFSSLTDVGELSVHHGVAQTRTPIMGSAQYGTYGLGFDLGIADAPFGMIFEGRPLADYYNEGRAPADVLAGAACPEMAKNAVVAPYSTATGDVESTPGVADYWEERDFRAGVVENFAGSVFVVHGLQDFNVNPHQVAPFFNELPQDKKMLLGQWAHHYPDEGQFTSRADFAAILKAWLDRHLKGMDVATGPIVEVADARTGEYRAYAAWPPAGATPRTFGLRGDGSMAEGAGTPLDALVATPGGVRLGDTCVGAGQIRVLGAASVPPGPARFRTAALPAGFRLAGVGHVDVTIDPAVPVELAATLCDGNRVVAHGATHSLYASATGAPEPFVPGLPLVVRVEFEPAEYSVPAGSRLTLVVRAGDYPGDADGQANSPHGTAQGVVRVTAGAMTLPTL